MSYRFVRITNYYPQYLKNFYLKNPNAGSKSFSEAYKMLVDDSFETASCYTKNLNRIGVNAFDIISNDHVLQNKWIRENKLVGGIASDEIILHQLKHYNPQVLWIDDFSFVNAEWKEKLLKKVPSIKILIGHICAPYNSEMRKKFKLFDIMFTCTPCFKIQLENLGIKTHLLYHGFESNILNNINVDNRFPELDFLFSGSLYTGSGFHKSRIEYIEKILRAGIDISLYSNLESWGKVMAKKAYTNLS